MRGHEMLRESIPYGSHGSTIARITRVCGCVDLGNCVVKWCEIDALPGTLRSEEEHLAALTKTENEAYAKAEHQANWSPCAHDEVLFEKFYLSCSKLALGPDMADERASELLRLFRIRFPCRHCKNGDKRLCGKLVF
jgi:hypothetical protein